MKKELIMNVVEALIEDLRTDLYMSIEDVLYDDDDYPVVIFKYANQLIGASEDGIEWIESDLPKMIKELELQGYSVFKDLPGIEVK